MNINDIVIKYNLSEKEGAILKKSQASAGASYKMLETLMTEPEFNESAERLLGLNLVIKEEKALPARHRGSITLYKFNKKIFLT